MHVQNKLKNSLKVLLSVVFAVIVLWLLQGLLMPKYMGQVVEGALIAEYYGETKKHDVIFIGDCEVYENVSPVTLWEEYGITSYIRGSAQQLIWQSYYLLEETLKYEKPELVVFNVLSMQYNEPQREAYNRMTLDGMKWSSSKIKSIQASMLAEEEFLDYVFPLLRYHSRWSELTEEDFQYWFSKDKISHNGYYMRADVLPMTGEPVPRRLSDYQFGENAYQYLDKITELCLENDIKLILIKAPSIYPHWYEEWELQMENYAQKHNLPYYNFLELFEETGIDLSTDTYDAGLHLNVYGAEKMSVYLGKIFSEEYGLKDHRQEAEYVEIWEEKAEAYHRMKKELEEIEREKTKG